ncbi:MAG: hypothetical protein LC753_12330 [Acidobacteria bacterium]|nr:hypothetical protein [Acidobacteriota bacterium]MCA1651024.1 hypothetical protein [Acidobacteriota bacterium]
MGYDAPCTLRYEGRTAPGTAWLEHKDLVFRGPFRLVIPLNGIEAATASDGRLEVRFGGSVAEFQIGASAAKWAARITNPPSRLDKLGVKAGMRVVLVGLNDEEFVRELAKRGARAMRGAPKAGAPPADIIFYAASTRDSLEQLGTLARRLSQAGALWVVRGKAAAAPVTEGETMAAGKRAGLVDVKVVSFSETHTAEKFVIPVAKRAGHRRSALASPRKRR